MAGRLVSSLIISNVSAGVYHGKTGRHKEKGSDVRWWGATHEHKIRSKVAWQYHPISYLLMMGCLIKCLEVRSVQEYAGHLVWTFPQHESLRFPCLKINMFDSFLGEPLYIHPKVDHPTNVSSTNCISSPQKIQTLLEEFKLQTSSAKLRTVRHRGSPARSFLDELMHWSHYWGKETGTAMICAMFICNIRKPYLNVILHNYIYI